MSALPPDAPLDPLAGLNPIQREAVRHGEGPLLLLAGAGSGKTRVVTRRIARLLAEGERPESILALTFTNRAAREMRERVAELLGLSEAPPLQISTFHALGARFLRRHAEWFGRSRSFSIYDDGDQLDMIRQAAARQQVELKAADAKVLRRFFDQAKNAGEGAAAVSLPLEWAKKLDGPRLGADYDELLERADAFDFGDLIVRPADLLAHERAIAARYRAQWRWILVDEFQDTNAAQYRWLKLLAPPETPAPGPNLFVVGDDDQSIYGWRGAEVENILRFPDEYPGAQVVRLEQNYRSHQHILTAANEVIANNRRRLGKALWTERTDGMRIELHEAAEGRREGAWIAGRIAQLCSEDGIAPGEIAVLMRANHLSLDVEEGLRLLAIPHTVVRGRSFYDRAEVADALAYVRLLVNPHDDVAFRRAVNTPSRGVGDKSLARLAAVADARDCSLWEAAGPALDAGELRGRAASGVDAFVAVITAHRELLDDDGRALDLRGAATRVTEALEAAGFLTDLRVAAAAGEQDRDRYENVQRLLLALSTFEAEAPAPTLAAWLETVKLISEIDVADPRLGAVSLMTVHAAKGLEFPVVFLMGLEEGIFPHHRSIEDDTIEEERRLCYVAITRARHRLVLTWSRERRSFADVKRNRPSRFLRELPADALEARFQPEPPPMRRRPAPVRPQSFDRHAARAREESLYSDPIPADDFGGGGMGWRRGMKVLHAQLGVGVVEQVKAHGSTPRLVIDFPDVGRRTIATDWVSPYDG
ncbi:MAG: UvrD-helicase domain-containing protein [bacterium]|nr:UvrD-helicase domain-containing protein [Myxococcales bacterium]